MFKYLALLFCTSVALAAGSGPPNIAGTCVYTSGTFSGHPGAVSGGPTMMGYTPDQVAQCNPETAVQQPQPTPEQINRSFERFGQVWRQRYLGSPITPETLFRSQGPMRPILINQYQALSATRPATSELIGLINVGIIATVQADSYEVTGDHEEAVALQRIGGGILEVVTTLNPVAGTGRSTYEFVTGRDLRTGLELSRFDRGLAFAGILSGGSPRVAGRLIQFFRRNFNMIRGVRNVERTLQDATEIVEEHGAVLNQPRVEPQGEWQIYHRVETRTQTPEDALLIERTGQLRGRAPRWSDLPAAQAYEGPLPEGARGIEFRTRIRPDAGGVPGYPRWSHGTDGVIRVDEDFAGIPVEVLRNTQR